jgi:hypothetical protein
MAHFIPCHKEVIAIQSMDLFISNCYRLHDVPKVLVSERGPNKFVGMFWQSFMDNLNTKLSMSSVRHPRNDDFAKIIY